jgi:hypothetical protein
MPGLQLPTPRPPTKVAFPLLFIYEMTTDPDPHYKISP